MLVLSSQDDKLQRVAAELTELKILMETAGQFFDSAREKGQGLVSTIPPVPSDLNAPLISAQEDPVSDP